MPTQMPELEARLVAKRALRFEAAKAELAKSSNTPLTWLAWLAPWFLAVAFSDRLTHYYGISSQLFFLLCTLFGSLFVSVGQVAVLHRKVNALVEIAKAQGAREDAA